jgi:CRISPR system Cascade subunit CasD
MLLRIGGPMQSWGTHSTWSERDTNTYPTRSALIGMIAAARGEPRGTDLGHYRTLRVDVRIDRPGRRLVDFHTVGGGRSAAQTVPTSDGGRRPQGKGTIVSNRHYLTDAVFTVALTADDDLLDLIESGLRHPHWAGYLGRRSCPPDGPLILARVDHPQEWLHAKLPLARRRQWNTENVAVDFITDIPPAGPPTRTEEIPDVPISFDEINPVYRTRTVHRYRRHMPATLCAGYGTEYLQAVEHALKGTS